MKGVVKMILYFKNMKALELLRSFKQLSHIDKLRLTIHLFENSNLDVSVNNEMQMLRNQLNELDKNYTSTLVNFSKYRNLTLMCAIFMEMSEKDRKIVILDMINNIFKTSKNN